MKKLLTAALFAVLTAPVAMAQDAAEHVVETATAGIPYGAIAGAVALMIAAAFGAVGQAKAIAAACEGTARNPGATGNIRTTLLIGLAFIESLVLYVFAVAFLIMNK